MTTDRPVSGPAGGGLPYDLVRRLDAKLRERQDAARSLDAVYEFQLEEPASGAIRIDLHDTVQVQQNASEGARAVDCRLLLSTRDFIDWIEGRADGQALFLAGKLRVDGDLGLAMKLQQLAELLR